jgi:hypothetical protein
MATGYTHPILEGKITNFKDYAKLCMRAFGATMHMRDDSFDVEYVKREPSQYHINSLKSWQETLSELSSMSDEEFMEKRRKEIQDDIDYHQKKIIECESNVLKLNSILADVQAWEPPTKEHEGIKKFMIEQITETLRFDGDSRYHVLEIKKKHELLENINPSQVKIDYIEDAKRSIQYHMSNHNDEIKRAEDSNKWVETLLNSL